MHKFLLWMYYSVFSAFFSLRILGKTRSLRHITKFLEYVTYDFLLPTRESIVLGQIFEAEILMDLYVLKSPEPENHIFSVCFVCMCLCLCLWVCVRVWVSVIYITQKKIKVESWNLIFYICIIGINATWNLL